MIVSAGRPGSRTCSKFAKVLSRFDPCLSNESRVDVDTAIGNGLGETIERKEHLLSINSSSHLGEQEMADVMLSGSKTDKIIFAVGAA